MSIQQVCLDSLPAARREPQIGSQNLTELESGGSPGKGETLGEGDGRVRSETVLPRLGYDLVNHLAEDIGEPHIPAGESDGETRVVDA